MATKKHASSNSKPATPKRASRPAPSAKALSAEDDKARVQHIREALAEAIPEPRCELDHRNAFELLIATILSAQSTDKMVNTVTPELFARYPNVRSLAEASQEEIEKLVHKTGFYRNKAKAIRGAAQKLLSDFGGEVPKTLEEAITLPGVARKTANVVIGTAYRIPTGIVVDTHVGRVARRLALTTAEDPIEVEQDLCAIFPKDEWIDTGHRLLLHGRYTCLAKKPKCDECPLRPWCPSAEA